MSLVDNSKRLLHWLFRWPLILVERYRAIQQDRINRLRDYLPFLQKFLDELDKLTNGSAYLPHSAFRSLKEGHDRLSSEIKPVRWVIRKLEQPERELVQSFKLVLAGLEKARSRNNRRFVRQEIVRLRGFFDSVEGRRLDLQQRRAIVTMEDNNLIVAGAGSGKTTTIVGRVKYLQEVLEVPAEEILCISFTNESAQSLRERIGNKSLNVLTFHKFGKETLEKISRIKLDVFDSAKFPLVFRQILQELVRTPKYLDRLVNFLVFQLQESKSPFDFATKAEYIQYLRENRIGTLEYKHKKKRGATTLKQEVVKSLEECQIANFLFLNNLDYEYEPKYEFETATEAFRQYRPDFVVRQGDKQVYIEHLGMSQTGEVPKFFADQGETYEAAKQRYHEKRRWFREQHQKHGTLLIETYSHEMQSGTLFENLAQNLQNHGFVLQPRSGEEVFKVISEVAKEQIDSFEDLARTFLSLYKTNNHKFFETDSTARSIAKDNRSKAFLELVRPILARYEDYLKKEQQIDFADMINKAAEAIFRRDVEVGYSHVIIDEFQDISDARLQLLRAIRSQKPNCKIFAVGDDWQAIYRFAGSDVTLFTQFAEQFGETAVMRIETTYRFAPPLLDVASKFILKNPSQYRKILRAADRQKRTKLDILPTEAGGEVGQALKRIAAEGETFVGKRVLILGRYGHDEKCMAAPQFKLKDAKNRIYEWSDQLSGKVVRASNVQFMTMHKAKGIEGEIVILANCGAGRYGMPAEIVDDPMLDMLLAKPENHPNAEERRLFYVALTRAKERAMIVVPTDNPSKFAVELGFKASRAPKSACPECESGEIIMKKRNADGSEFYGCTNYYFGCSYTEVRRPLAKSSGR